MFHRFSATRALFSVFVTALVLSIPQQSTAGQLVQTFSFGDFEVEAHNAIDQQTGGAHVFLPFEALAAAQGVVGVLESATWHLQGTLRAEFFVESVPEGSSYSGSAFATFPQAFGLWSLPGSSLTFPPSTIQVAALADCSAGPACSAVQDLDFGLTIPGTDFALFNSGFIGWTFILRLDNSVVVIPVLQPYLGVARASFAGDENTLTLVYTYVPEPSTLVLLSLALTGLGFARRRKLR